MAREHASAGGQGIARAAVSRSDLRLYRRAIRGGYNIDPKTRQNLVAVAREIMLDADASDRDRLAASKVLLAADAMDLAVEKLALEREQGPAQQNHLHLHGEAAQGDMMAALQSQRGRDAVANLRDAMLDADAVDAGTDGRPG